MKRLISLYLALIILLLSGCKSQRQYTFAQDFKNIEEIEIIYVPPYAYIPNEGYQKFEAIVKIKAEQRDDFIDEFCKIPCYTYFLDPYQAIEGNVIRITYLDGAYEVISEHTGLHHDTKNNWWYPPYYFDGDTFNSFISAKIDEFSN